MRAHEGHLKARRSGSSCLDRETCQGFLLIFLPPRQNSWVRFSCSSLKTPWKMRPRSRPEGAAKASVFPTWERQGGMAEGAAGEAPGRAFPRSGKTGVCAKRRPLRGRVEVFEAPTNLGEDPNFLAPRFPPHPATRERLEMWVMLRPAGVGGQG